MKCINRLYLILTFFSFILLSGCSTPNITVPYKVNSDISAFSIIPQSDDVKMDSFASNLCVGNANVTRNTSVNMTEATSAALFDVNNSNIVYGKNMHERLAPASMTKVMTMILVMEKIYSNEIKYEDFSTTTLDNGVVCATLFDKTIFEIYNKFYENEKIYDFSK